MIDDRQKEGRSYAKVVIGKLEGEERKGKENHANTDDEIIGGWNPDERSKSFLNLCLVGEAKSIDNISAMKILIKDKALGVEDIFGLCFLIWSPLWLRLLVDKQMR